MKWSCPECGAAMDWPFWPETEDEAWCSHCRDERRLHEFKRELWRALGLDRSEEPNYASKDLLPVLVAVVRRLLDKEIAHTTAEHRALRQEKEAAA